MKYITSLLILVHYCSGSLIFVTPPAADLILASDLVLEDIEGFGPHGWSYSEKEWFNYIQDFSEIATVINKHPDANLAAYNWDQFDSGTNGLWFFVHQLPPVLNPPEPEIRYNPGSGSSKYHHLLISYKINGSGRIDVFVSSEKTPVGAIRNDCLDSCPPGFQHAMIPLSDPDFEIGVHSFRLGFNTTNVGDFILIDRIIAYANRTDLTLPTGVTFPSTSSMSSTISTTHGPTTTENPVTEICQCWNETCRTLEELHDMETTETTYWKPQNADLMEYFNFAEDLIEFRNWSTAVTETLTSLYIDGVWLVEFIQEESISWGPDFYLGLLSGPITEVQFHYFAYGNVSLGFRYRFENAGWSNTEIAKLETMTEDWANVTMNFPNVAAVQLFPETEDEESFILIDKLIGHVDCAKPMKDETLVGKKPRETCTCFTITTFEWTTPTTASTVTEGSSIHPSASTETSTPYDDTSPESSPTTSSSTTRITTTTAVVTTESNSHCVLDEIDTTHQATQWIIRNPSSLNYFDSVEDLSASNQLPPGIDFTGLDGSGIWLKTNQNDSNQTAQSSFLLRVSGLGSIQKLSLRYFIYGDAVVIVRQVIESQSHQVSRDLYAGDGDPRWIVQDMDLGGVAEVKVIPEAFSEGSFVLIDKLVASRGRCIIGTSATTETISSSPVAINTSYAASTPTTTPSSGSNKGILLPLLMSILLLVITMT